MSDKTSQNEEQELIEFYGEKELRWLQLAARNGVIGALEEQIKRILIVQPTGSGKTITIACTLDNPRVRQLLGVIDRPMRILFAAHMHRLLSQAEETFISNHNIELIPYCYFSDLPQDVIDQGWDVAVLDEAHHEACMSFQLQLEDLDNAPIIGLTATPDRPDGCLIKFEAIIEPISRQEAVEQGFLAETNLNSILDTSGRDKSDIIVKLFETYLPEMTQTMVFLKTKKEVAFLTEYLINRGVNAVGLLNQKKDELNNILNEFSAGDIQFILNCQKVGEGVDVKGCSHVILGRQLGSYTLYNQIIGRASRPDSDCNIWELINPLSARNLDGTVVVGTPKRHRLIHSKRGVWNEMEFDYAA